MIGYHYSPTSNQKSIRKHGLLVPVRHPKLTKPVTCSAGHRNPHISLARNPHDAWLLSGGFLLGRIYDGDRQLYFNVAEHWDLYQIDLSGIRYRSYGMELQSRIDIPYSKISRVGRRQIID